MVAQEQEVQSKQKSGKEQSTSLVYLAWAISTIGVGLVFAFQSFYPEYIGSFSNLITPIVAALAFASSLTCLKRYGFNLRGRFQRIWLYFAIGMACWMLAEVTWGIYYFILNVNVPYPSAADIFYIGAYLPIWIGLFTYFHYFRSGLTKKKLAISVGSIAFSAALVLALVLPLEFAQSTPIVTTLTNIIYPVLDLLLLSLAILGLSLFAGGTLGKWWIVFVLGIILDIIGDEVFLYLDAQGKYYNGSFDDMFYIAAYFLFALAFYIHKIEL